MPIGTGTDLGASGPAAWASADPARVTSLARGRCRPRGQLSGPGPPGSQLPRSPKIIAGLAMLAVFLIVAIIGPLGLTRRSGEQPARSPAPPTLKVWRICSGRKPCISNSRRRSSSTR